MFGNRGRSLRLSIVVRAACAAAFVVTVGCSNTITGPETGQNRTALGFVVVPGEFGGFDPLAVDAVFMAFSRCLDERGFGESVIDPFSIRIYIIRTPFPCSASPTGMCNGKYGGGEIYTDPDLEVLPHELAHAEIEARTGDADADHGNPMFRACR